MGFRSAYGFVWSHGSLTWCNIVNWAPLASCCRIQQIHDAILCPRFHVTDWPRVLLDDALNFCAPLSNRNDTYSTLHFLVLALNFALSICCIKSFQQWDQSQGSDLSISSDFCWQFFMSDSMLGFYHGVKEIYLEKSKILRLPLAIYSHVY